MVVGPGLPISRLQMNMVTDLTFFGKPLQIHKA